MMLNTLTGRAQASARVPASTRGVADRAAGAEWRESLRGSAGLPRFLDGRGLTVSRPEDASERQADSLAERIIGAEPCPGCTPAAPCATCGAGIQRSAEGPAGTASAVPELGPGQALDAASRDFFEPRLRRDLADVRIHAGARDGMLARSLSARAFAVGNDVVFGEGRYQPGTDSGRQLLAHELAHVVTERPANTLARQADSGAPDSGLAPDSGGPSDAGVPLPAGVPPTPAGPMFDSLFGACLTEEEGRRRDAFALRPLHLDRNIPSTTFGMFDADYFPLAGLMSVTVKMKFNFVSADNAPGFAEWLSRTIAGEDLSRFYWSDTEKDDFKRDLIGRISSRWSGQHTMVSTKPCWNFRALPLVSPVEVANDADAHYVTTVHKLPSPGISRTSSTNDPDIAHPERPATADLDSGDVVEDPDFASVSVATSERQRIESALASAAASPVLFANDSDAITPTAATALTAFADALKQKNPSDPLIPINVDGFASLEGEVGHNVSLSERRAIAVRSFLAGLGVPQPIGVLGHGPVGSAGDAANRKADITVDHAFETTYAANRFSAAEHEFGHMLGLPDEYQNNTTGTLGTQQALYSGLVTSAGVQGPSAWGALTASQMSAGVDVLPRHYVTLWEALGRMTAPDIAQSEWSLT
jgi:outer membrane protein OmpA-like peptidoglycan-associated protein